MVSFNYYNERLCGIYVMKNEKKKIKKINIKKLFITILTTIGIIAGIIFPLAESISYFLTYISDLRAEVSSISAKLDSFQNDVDDRLYNIETRLEDIDEYLYYDGGVKDQLGIINEALNIKVINAPDDSSAEIISSIKQNDINYSTSKQYIVESSLIGYDINGNKYIARDLIGETVLLTYTEDDKEVYFLGQYNENYHWDGYCVTNSYFNNGVLFGICESNFDDGDRLDYISFYYSDNSKWIYANREKINDENVGVTINYYIENNRVKNFTETNVRRSDILYADNYLETVDKSIIQYYTGNTVDNRYNDSTGNAYEVKYDKDGTIRILYVGKFADGVFSDTSGNAFSIVYHDETGSYYCNTGDFENGRALSPSNVPLTYDDINEIIKKYSFNCNLNWK